MTDYSNGNTNGPMGYHYLRHLVNRESCGEAYARLREELWFYRDNYYRFNLLGDPSVVVFPATPRPDPVPDGCLLCQHEGRSA